MSLDIACFLEQCPLRSETSLGRSLEMASLGRSLEMVMPSICLYFGTEEHSRAATESVNTFCVLRLWSIIWLSVSVRTWL